MGKEECKRFMSPPKERKFFWIFRLTKNYAAHFALAMRFFICKMGKTDEKLTREECLKQLQDTAEKCGRYPKKSDFDEETVAMIKSYFGPWPRALEEAGVKEVNQRRIEKKLERRKRMKENQLRYRKAHPKIKKEERQ